MRFVALIVSIFNNTISIDKTDLNFHIHVEKILLQFEHNRVETGLIQAPPTIQYEYNRKYFIGEWRYSNDL